MKKLTAILLLLIVAFNFYGYRLVISYLQQNSCMEAEARIDQQDYHEAELISIKTTLRLPYYNSSPDFERAYGSIKIDGVEYEYVKRRIYQDTLELLCLPNHQKTALNAVSGELAKGAVDGASVPIKKGLSFKITLPDYCQQYTEGQTLSLSFKSKIYPAIATHFLSSDFTFQQEKPPQFNA